jgi:hypothetical protein
VNPVPKERLEKTLARVAREQGLDQERLRRWVSFLAMCGVLERAIRDGILSRYYLKGGVAMELRFAGAARATKDLDLEPVINFIPLESKQYPSASLSQTMEAWGTRGKSAIPAM